MKLHGKKEKRKHRINIELLNDADRVATLETLQRAWDEGQVKAEPVVEEAIEPPTVEEIPEFTEDDIGKPFKARQIDGIFGNINGLTTRWEMGFRLLELPGEFRDSYILESPEGKRVSLFDIERMTDEDGIAYSIFTAERIKELPIDEAVALWRHYEAINSSLNIPQEIGNKVSVALAVAV